MTQGKTSVMLGLERIINGKDKSPMEVSNVMPRSFEDTSFVTGDSPVPLDCNTALGRNATNGFIINDGAGNFTIALSTDGSAFGDELILKANEKFTFSGLSVDSIRITWVADSAYRVGVF